jgi:hypothetical protein
MHKNYRFENSVMGLEVRNLIIASKILHSKKTEYLELLLFYIRW